MAYLGVFIVILSLFCIDFTIIVCYNGLEFYAWITKMPTKKLSVAMVERAIVIKDWKHKAMTYAMVADELHKETGVKISPNHLRLVMIKYQSKAKENNNEP